MNASHSFTEGSEAYITDDADLKTYIKMKPTRFQKELQRELERLESIVLTEELKESLARERKEGANKQIENLKASNGAYSSL